MFQKKKIMQTKRVCLRLKEARESAGFSVEQMAEKTKLDIKYITALENCDFDALPKSRMYHRQFMRAYLRALGIEADTYIRQYVFEEERREAPSKKQKKHPHTAIAKRFFHNIPGALKYSGLVVVVLLIAGYLVLQVNRILTPPRLIVLAPQDGLSTEESTLLVVGETEKDASILINGQNISSLNNGRFERQIELTPGLNTLIITATKKHGKSSKETLHVVLRASRPLSQR